MGLYRYAVQMQEKTAKSQVYDQNASYKDLTQVCRAIRGRQADEARTVLEECVSLKKAIPYFRHAKGCGARGELGGKKGRYPKKEARIMLGLVNDAVANAKHMGMDEKKLYVAHAAGYKQNSFHRHRRYWAGGSILGYGKQATWADYETARAEVVLAEREPRPKKMERAQKAGKKGAGQKAEKAAAAAKAVGA